MAFEMKKKFAGPNGELFTVDEVPQVDGKLWVHYTKVETGEKYSCLLDAFSERFKLLEQ
jgi:hypothetical protein